MIGKSLKTIDQRKDYMIERWFYWMNTIWILNGEEVEWWNAFYMAFYNWNRNQPPELQYKNKKQLFNKVRNLSFSDKIYARKEFTKIDQWKNYMIEKWWGLLNTSQIRNTDWWRLFYMAFYNWNKKKSIKEQQENKQKLFYWLPRINSSIDYSQLKTIDQRKECMIENWFSWMNTDGKIDKEIINGGSYFYQKFRNWNKLFDLGDRDFNHKILFPEGRNYRQNNSSIDDREKNMIESWFSWMNTKWILNGEEIEWWRPFIQSFYRWNKKQPKKDREENIQKLLGIIYNERGKCSKFDNFSSIFDRRSYLIMKKRNDLSLQKIRETKEWATFYTNFCTRNSKYSNDQKQKNREVLFGERKKPK